VKEKERNFNHLIEELIEQERLEAEFYNYQNENNENAEDYMNDGDSMDENYLENYYNYQHHLRNSGKDYVHQGKKNPSNDLMEINYIKKGIYNNDIFNYSNLGNIENLLEIDDERNNLLYKNNQLNLNTKEKKQENDEDLYSSQEKFSNSILNTENKNKSKYYSTNQGGDKNYLSNYNSILKDYSSNYNSINKDNCDLQNKKTNNKNQNTPNNIIQPVLENEIVNNENENSNNSSHHSNEIDNENSFNNNQEDHFQNDLLIEDDDGLGNDDGIYQSSK